MFLYTYNFVSDEGPMLETLDYSICIGSTLSFLYFDLYLYSAYALRICITYIYIYMMKRWVNPLI